VAHLIAGCAATFFPPSWSKARIEYEVAEAFKNRQQRKTGPGEQGVTPSGIRIRFYRDQKNQRTTFFPEKD